MVSPPKKKPVMMIFGKQLMEDVDDAGLRDKMMDNYEVMTPKMIKQRLKNHKWTKEQKEMLKQVEERSVGDEEDSMVVTPQRKKTINMSNSEINQAIALGMSGVFGDDVTYSGFFPPGNVGDPNGLGHMIEQQTGRSAPWNGKGIINNMEQRGMIDRNESGKAWKDLGKKEDSKETSFGGFYTKNSLKRAWKWAFGGKEKSWMSDLTKRGQIKKDKSVKIPESKMPFNDLDDI